jgi:hypothetical protein
LSSSQVILKSEAEEFTVRIIRASGLIYRLMLSKKFGCKDQLWHVGEGKML